MTPASGGRFGRIALTVLGLLALLFAGAVGARLEAHDHAAGATIVAGAHCLGCAPGGDGHPDHDRGPGQERHAGCAVACVSGAIAPAAPTILGADLTALAWPRPATVIASRSTRPEPEPPRGATRA
ncbi:hypothetical protein [Salinarimonas sp.]|uniref:hypothetical protein n=1 Tax=Salinarimonas sp. TaxID=2766526 RepID=UPI0032D9ABCE